MSPVGDTRAVFLKQIGVRLGSIIGVYRYRKTIPRERKLSRLRRVLSITAQTEFDALLRHIDDAIEYRCSRNKQEYTL
jgi:hypothetical protein